MYSLVEILHVLEDEIGLVCWQLLHEIHATEIFEFNLPVNFLNYLSNWVNLLDISTGCEKLRAFERYSSFKTSVLHLEDQQFNFNDHAVNFFFTFSIANMAENETQRELQTMILCISSHFLSMKGYESKA